jgi:TolB-like protein/tetratricopeptide (TPR) repeat protein
MEFVEGKTLREIVPEGPLPTKRLLQLATQIAEGLAKAHTAGIVHRDLKPENLMVTEDGYVKILDFGLAKLRPQPSDAESEVVTATKEGTVLGTVGYMSPEQAKGEPADHRSDQFSLGAILYEMATGRRAFQRGSSVQTLSAIIEDNPEPIPMSSDVPPRLRTLVERCLSKAPEKRYGATTDLARDLKEIQEELLRRSSNESINSIAVLPLADLSSEPGQEYFADGMTEALITDLAKIGSLKVISRTSVMQYKGVHKPLPAIARELGVSAVVEGSVLRAGDRVRINAQLIQAKTDQHLWAESYERDIRDILTLQSEVARTVAREIKVKLTPREHTRLTQTRPVNREAHDAYLKGRYFSFKYTEEGLKKSVQYHERALEIDPTYASAYAGLADTYNFSGWFGMPPKEAFPKAKAAAAKALEIDETIAEAHSALGYIATYYDWNWTSAERELRRALELNPSYATAHLFFSWYWNCHGAVDRALEAVRKAKELDPLSTPISGNVATALWLGRLYDQAIDHLQRLLELDPNSPIVHFVLGLSYVEKKKYSEAIEAHRTSVTLSQGAPEFVAWLGRTYGVAGKRDEALKILDQLTETSKRRYVSPHAIARVYLGLGDMDKVIEWLNRAYEDRSGWMAYMKVDPSLDPLRGDARFQDILRRMNFPE